MKNFNLTIVLLMMVTAISAQELIVGGAMESADASSWTIVNVNPNAGPTSVSPTWGYTTDGPTAGIAGCFRVTSPSGMGADDQVNQFLYQRVTIQRGVKYVADFAFKNVGNFIGSWVEFVYTENAPVAGSDLVDGVKLGGWMDPDWGSGCIDDEFDVVAAEACDAGPNTLTIDGTGTVDIYIGVKFGGANQSSSGRIIDFEFMFDEISLQTAPLIVGGSMEVADMDSWTLVNVNPNAGPTTVSPTWGYTTDGPTNGNGGCFRVTSPSGMGSDDHVNQFLYQKVTIQRGVEYTGDFAFKNINNFTGSWVEFVFTENEPIAGSDLFDGVKLGGWMDPDWGSGCIDDEFDVVAADACDAGPNTFTIDGTGTVDIYFGVKFGGANQSSSARVIDFDFMFDEIRLFQATGSPTAINDELKTSSLKVYPNPSSVNVTVENVESGQLVIYSMLGNKVMTVNAPAGKVEINIAHLSKGMYILKDGAATKTFVKK